MPKLKTSKQAILQTALSVFKKKGYTNTTMADLAHAAGIEKAHLYYYFDNKESLMRELLLGFEAHIQVTLFALAYNETTEIGERLQLILSGLEALFLETELGCLVADTALQTRYGGESPFLDITQQFFRRLIHTIAHLYQDRYSPHYAVFKAEQAVNDLYGGLVMTQIFGDNSYLKNALKRIGKKV